MIQRAHPVRPALTLRPELRKKSSATDCGEVLVDGQARCRATRPAARAVTAALLSNTIRSSDSRSARRMTVGLNALGFLACVRINSSVKADNRAVILVASSTGPS